MRAIEAAVAATRGIASMLKKAVKVEELQQMIRIDFVSTHPDILARFRAQGY